MNAVKTAEREATRDRGVGKTDGAELAVGDEPALAVGQSLDASFFPHSGRIDAWIAHPPDGRATR
jgi:hypothetical protein